MRAPTLLVAQGLPVARGNPLLLTLRDGLVRGREHPAGPSRVMRPALVREFTRVTTLALVRELTLRMAIGGAYELLVHVHRVVCGENLTHFVAIDP